MTRRLVPWDNLVADRAAFADCPRNGIAAIVFDSEEPRILNGLLDDEKEILLVDLDDLPNREGSIVGFRDMDEAIRDAVEALGSA